MQNRAAVETMVQQGIDQLGKIDILVNNAAMSIRKPFLDIPVADVSRTIDVCMWGVFHCSQVAARHMVERGAGGKILIISSVHAFIPFGNSVAYNNAKAGINHMGYTMATELTQHRINVNVIEPGVDRYTGRTELCNGGGTERGRQETTVGQTGNH